MLRDRLSLSDGNLLAQLDSKEPELPIEIQRAIKLQIGKDSLYKLPCVQEMITQMQDYKKKIIANIKSLGYFQS